MAAHKVWVHLQLRGHETHPVNALRLHCQSVRYHLILMDAASSILFLPILCVFFFVPVAENSIVRIVGGFKLQLLPNAERCFAEVENGLDGNISLENVSLSGNPGGSRRMHSPVASLKHCGV